jgi:hypothetical protein
MSGPWLIKRAKQLPSGGENEASRLDEEIDRPLTFCSRNPVWGLAKKV